MWGFLPLRCNFGEILPIMCHRSWLYDHMIMFAARKPTMKREFQNQCDKHEVYTDSWKYWIRPEWRELHTCCILRNFCVSSFLREVTLQVTWISVYFYFTVLDNIQCKYMYIEIKYSKKFYFCVLRHSQFYAKMKWTRKFPNLQYYGFFKELEIFGEKKHYACVKVFNVYVDVRDVNF